MKKDENKKPNRKKMLIMQRTLLLIALTAILTLVPFVYDAVKYDPNLTLKKVATALKEDSTVDVTYSYNPSETGIFSKERIRLYSFTPEESAEYIFCV